MQYSEIPMEFIRFRTVLYSITFDQMSAGKCIGNNDLHINIFDAVFKFNIHETYIT